MDSRPKKLLSVAVAAVLSSACTPPAHDIDIRFVARLGGMAAGCESAAGTTLSDLRFYVSGAAVRSTGERVPLVLDERGRWQQPDLALIDLEDGTGACLNGTPDTNDRLTGTVRAAGYRGLEFTVGVPFERNHADPLRAEPPLDDSTMHWHWRTGYKFLRAGLASPNDGFWVHVGSSACAGTVGAISGCANPNRINVSLPDFEPGDVVVVDLDALARVLALDDAAASDCSSGPAEAACASPFKVLGLPFGDDSGPGDSGAQQLFRVQKQ